MINQPLNQRLPLHPLPFYNESLSSYICRLTEINLISGRYLVAYGSHLDLAHDVWTNRIKFISILTGHSKKILMRTTIKRYEKRLYLKTPRNFMFWFTHNVRICPFCLKESLYYRIHWNLRCVFMCCKHRVLLIDKCQKCGTPIRDIENRYVYKIGFCRKCGADFRKFRPISLRNDRLAFRVQSKILKMLETKTTYRLKKNLKISPKYFFSALGLFYSMISKLEYIPEFFNKFKIKKEIISKVARFFPCSRFVSNKNPGVEFDYVTFIFAYQIFSSWPSNFFKLLEQLCKSAMFKKNWNGFFLSRYSIFCKLRKSPLSFIRKAHSKWINEFVIQFMQDLLTCLRSSRHPQDKEYLTEKAKDIFCHSRYWIGIALNTVSVKFFISVWKYNKNRRNVFLSAYKSTNT